MGFLENPALHEKYLCGLIQTVARLADDTNVKISLTAIRILTAITNHHNTFLSEDCLRLMMPTLVKRLSDKKAAIRSALIKAFHSLSYVRLRASHFRNLAGARLSSS